MIVGVIMHIVFAVGVRMLVDMSHSVMGMLVIVYDMAVIMFVGMTFLTGATKKSARLMRCEIRDYVETLFKFK